MRACLLFLALAAAASQALGQTVPVRSGEHDTFTRFVMQIPQGTEWSLTEGDRKAAVRIRLDDIRFETKDVFGRIPRTRVRDIRQAGPGDPLEFLLNCSCSTRGFVQDGKWLVIDISDSKKKTTINVFANRRSFSNDRRYEFALPESPGNSVPNAPETGAILPPARAKTPAVKLPIVTRAQLSVTRIPSAESIKQKAAEYQIDQQFVDAKEQTLKSQIERAAGQGLIKGKPLPAEPAAVEVQEIQPPVTAVPSVESKPDRHENIKVVTVIDRDLGGVASRLGKSEPKKTCISSEQVALNKWSNDQPYSHQIGPLRTALVGEFDQINSATVLSLAKTYLHFGFGAEAANALTMLSENDEQTSVLRALARIMDQDHPSSGNPFSAQHGCETDAALWALFSEPQHVDESNEHAVTQALIRLPPHLRAYVGPKLAETFARAGKLETANSLLRAVTRTADDTNAPLELARASVAELGGQSELANGHREAALHTNSAEAAKALIELVQSKYKNRDAVSPEDVELIASYERQYRQTPLEYELHQVNVIGLALSGNFDAAYRALGPGALTQAGKSNAEAAVPLLFLLTEQADDVTFLKYGLPVTDGSADLPEQLGNAMARRLLDLGFALETQRLLSGSVLDGDSDERRLLKSKAALGQQLPHEAIAALLGLEGQQADNLRAQALALMHQYARAADLLETADAQGEAARNRWLTGDWRSMAANDAGKYSELAELAENVNRIGTNNEAEPLAQARSLVSDSQALRSNVAELLQAAALVRVTNE